MRTEGRGKLYLSPMPTRFFKITIYINEIRELLTESFDYKRTVPHTVIRVYYYTFKHYRFMDSLYFRAQILS
jgi:hypothetical protein